MVSVRANLRSLQSKFCIEETASFDVTEHLGRGYRVYSFASILDRWRRSGHLWARQTRGVELLKNPNSAPEESLAPQDCQQESSAAQVSLVPQLSSTPQHYSRSSGQDTRNQELVAASPLGSSDRKDSSAPQLPLAPQDSFVNSKLADRSRISSTAKESLPPQVSLAAEDSWPPRQSITPSTACSGRQESSAPQDSLPFIKKENKQTKQSSTSSLVSLTEFPETLRVLWEFPAGRVADDSIVSNMIRQVLINTPDASDQEIADFVRHKGSQIKNPKTSFMACLSAMVVSAMQGHRMTLYRQEKQKERAQREAEQREEFENIMHCAEFFAAQLEQHFAGEPIDSLTLRNAEVFLRAHIPQLPERLKQQVQHTLQRLAE